MRNPLSLEAFADWLGTMPSDERYCFFDTGACACCQYFDFLGMGYREVLGYTWIDPKGKRHKLPDGISAVVAGLPATFGAAHQRARALIAEQSP